ncbi:MAG: fumarate reductase subunit C [Candidatus Binatia bacterium]
MTASAPSAESRPRLYRPRVSTFWWLQSRPYLVFILRELSSVFVAWFVVYLLLLVRAVATGPAEYQEFLTWSAHPLLIVLNALTFAFVVFHAITWFNLAPRAMVVRVGGRRVPGVLIAASNYAAWVVVSLVAAYVLIGG